MLQSVHHGPAIPWHKHRSSPRGTEQLLRRLQLGAGVLPRGPARGAERPAADWSRATLSRPEPLRGAGSASLPLNHLFPALLLLFSDHRSNFTITGRHL